MINKRAELQFTTGFIVSAILIVFFLIVMILGLYQIVNSGKEKANLASCSASIDSLSRSKQQWLLDQNSFANLLSCPTSFETFKGRDEEKAKALIAKKMSECWRKLGSGKKDFFRQENAIFCIVCDVIEFPELKNINNFPEYIRNHNDTFSGKSYSSIFQFPPEQNKIDIDKKLAIVYTHAKETTFNARYQAYQAIHASNTIASIWYTTQTAGAYFRGSSESETYEARLNLVTYSSESLTGTTMCDFIEG